MKDRFPIVLLGLAVVPIAPLALYGPIAQAPCYHNFADQQTLLGIPHFWNVVSNLPFLAVGFFGLLRCRGWAPRFNRLTAWTFLVLTACVCFGSSYYHWAPDNSTLVWDRLFIALLSGPLAILAFEDFSVRVPRFEWLIPALLVTGLSVLIWAMTDDGDGGDLRAYIWATQVPALWLIALLIMRWNQCPRPGLWIGVLVLYGLARLTEVLDHQINELPLLLSGHTYKHLFAALACLLVVRILLLPVRQTPEGHLLP